MNKYIIFTAIIMMMFGCNADKKEYATSSPLMLDTTAIADTAQKIIKTADMRFRVKDVQQTKEQLGRTIKAEGGVITEFNIQSNIQETNKVKYSTDSLKEITSYRKEGFLIASVPSEKLDDFINGVAKMALFVNNQGMKMDDRSISYLANRLKLKNRVEALETIKKIGTKKSANVESSLYIKDDVVDKTIENMSIDQRVKFSTITLNFYQDNTVSAFIVANDNLDKYRPRFFQRLGLNIADGWVYFTEFILFLANLWMLFAMGGLVFVVVRYFVRRRKTTQKIT